MPETKTTRHREALPARVLVAGLFILVQVGLLVALVYAISLQAVWVYIPLWLASVIAVVVIINRKGNPSFKMAWIVFILLAPFCGGLIFLLWGSGKTTPAMRKRWRVLSARAAKTLPQDPQTVEKLKYADLFHSIQSDYLYRESSFPVYDNTHTTFYPSGEEFFLSVISEMESAERFIFLEFFILAEGQLWDRMLNVLKRKVKEGVEVRILYDDFGSIKRQRDNFPEWLEKMGIKVSIFNPLRPSVDLFLNNRNHRKIVVIDGKVSFTGGLNIGDEYINLEHPYGHWCDSGVRICGKATRSFTAMFCTMWNSINPEDTIRLEEYYTDYALPCAGFVQPYSDAPLGSTNPAEGLYMKILSSARQYVYITSPYLILDNTMITQLSLAAKSGVDVRIITPKKWDKWYVHPVTQYYYDELLEAGVRIYEYTPGFIHAKMFVSDDAVATVGTINVDYRSFYFHFECGAWICGNDTVLEIRDHVKGLFRECEEIRPEKWKRRPAIMKFRQSVLHLFAPFM